MNTPTPVIKTEELLKKETMVVKALEQKRDSVFSRFPLPFTLLSAFGLVATFYGFEHLIDQSKVLSENPLILLAVGVGTLLFTGALYKKLG